MRSARVFILIVVAFDPAVERGALSASANPENASFRTSVTSFDPYEDLPVSYLSMSDCLCEDRIYSNLISLIISAMSERALAVVESMGAADPLELAWRVTEGDGGLAGGGGGNGEVDRRLGEGVRVTW